MTETLYWRFDPLDTWFFREARGFETSGHNELSSLFPPPARTVAGAIRTLIGERQQVDWSRFTEADEYAELRALIGDGDSLGQLELTGPYPLCNGERLYPAPLHLLGKDGKDSKDGKYRFLEPGEPVTCDLGRVSLPQIRATADGPLPGVKPFEGAWLTREDLQRVLAGEAPEQVIAASALYDEEPRLGIARDNARRTGQDGLLYQTRHLRPHAGLAIGAGTRGLSGDVAPARDVIRLGGEGRPSAVQLISERPARLAAPEVRGGRLLLMLLTPADFDGDWLPPGFKPIDRDGIRVWQGRIHAIELTLECTLARGQGRKGDRSPHPRDRADPGMRCDRQGRTRGRLGSGPRAPASGAQSGPCGQRLFLHR